MAKGLRAGVIWVNWHNVFDATMPFGGYKMSGYGRESGMHALDLCTQVKVMRMKAASRRAGSDSRAAGIQGVVRSVPTRGTNFKLGTRAILPRSRNGDRLQ